MLSVILLAGGKGLRFGSPLPKQFLPLKGKPLALYSFECFISLPFVDEIIVVTSPEYHSLFQSTKIPIIFADPGVRRQDSVYHGLSKASEKAKWICVHDSARPCIKGSDIVTLLEQAKLKNAVTLGVPVKSTIKELNAEKKVLKTPDRLTLFEIQTPQIISKSLLQKGFEYALKHHLTVTDDVSLIELLNEPVHIVEGSYTNLKITTPEDLILADHYLS